MHLNVKVHFYKACFTSRNIPLVFGWSTYRPVPPLNMDLFQRYSQGFAQAAGGGLLQRDVHAHVAHRAQRRQTQHAPAAEARLGLPTGKWAKPSGSLTVRSIQ